MKALRTKVSTCAIALLMSCGFATSSIAGSSDFSGIYGAVWGAAGGAQIDGRHVAGNGEINEGQVGGVFPMAGYEIGFNLPLGDIFFLGVGHSKTQGGNAVLGEGRETRNSGGSSDNQDDTGTDGASQTMFTLEAKNLQEVYIMPSISIYDNSAFYVKLGRGIADLNVIGNVTGAPGNLTGDLIGMGTIAMTPSGIFIKTEASVTRFNDISITGVDGRASAKVEGTPDVVAGTVAVGFKF
jgi:hypothetical protein